MFQKINKKNIFFSVLFLFITFFSSNVDSSEILQDQIFVERAQVLEVINTEKKVVTGTDVLGTVQTLKVQITKGVEKGKIIVLENDINIFEPGDSVYINYIIRAEDGFEVHTITDPHRLPTIIFFSVLFIVLVAIIGGRQGVRGIISLLGSLILIIFLLLPLILNGFSPILASILVSSLIIVLGSYVTHGFNKTTSSAVIGMILTVIITGILAYISVHSAMLTGFDSDEAVYLNFNAKGNIDIVGILLGGIMIGLLGVLYDVAIGQAIAVEELHNIAPHVSRMHVFKRSMRMGREHIGALVNTLAIAYVGASLPLLLLFSNSSYGVVELVNREIFATEIVRTLIGSIGLVLAVPITTLISVFMLMKKNNIEDESVLKLEEEKLEHYSHKH